MSGSNIGTPQLVCPLLKNTELEQRITHHTRVRSPTLTIFIYKILYDYLSEGFALICHMMFNPHAVCQLVGFYRFVSPHPHGETDYLIALLLQHQASGSTVYTTAHTDQYSLFRCTHIRNQ